MKWNGKFIRHLNVRISNKFGPIKQCKHIHMKPVNSVHTCIAFSKSYTKVWNVSNKQWEREREGGGKRERKIARMNEMIWNSQFFNLQIIIWMACGFFFSDEKRYLHFFSLDDLFGCFSFFFSISLEYWQLDGKSGENFEWLIFTWDYTVQ